MYLLKKVFELREKTHQDHEKPFLEHLEDLRVMITRVVITLIISMIVCFVFRGELMEVLRAPAENVLLTQQLQTMPDEDKHPGIEVPSVETWNKAKEVEQIAAGLDAAQRQIFYASLEEKSLEFHARSVALLRAAKALPEDDRVGFVKRLGVDALMLKQLLALLESDPDVEPNAGANIRMMSALKPTETFMISIKLAFFAGIVLSFPLLLLFILQFVLPGLETKERKLLWPAMGIGFGLFLCGVLFAYFFVLPRALMFFYEYSGDLGVSNDWRIGEYISFATNFTLLFGLSFELPVVVMVLVKLGILNYETMSKTRTYAIVAIYVTAAIITPTPDIMTLNLMALPMYVLYELCIWLAWLDRKKNRQREEEEREEYRLRQLAWMDREYEEQLAKDHEGMEGYNPEEDESHDPDANMEEGDWHAPHHDDPHDPYHDEYHDEYQNHYGRYHGDHDEEPDHGKADDENWEQPDDAVVGDSDESGEKKPKPSSDEKNDQEEGDQKESDPSDEKPGIEKPDNEKPS